MRALRSHGIIKDTDLFKISNKDIWCYEQQYLGYNYRMSDISAALGLSQLKRLKFFIKRRTEIFKIYKENLSNLPLKLLDVPNNIISSHHLAIIRLNNKDEGFHRQIFNKLRAKNIGVQVHYTPVHLQFYYRKLGFSIGDFPKAEEYSKNAISIPIYPSISSDDIQRVIKEIRTLLYQE